MKGRKFIVCSDVHGDMQDPEAVAAIHHFIADFKPEIRVLAGDLWDFRNLRKGASDDEKAASLVDDWEAGMEFSGQFFKGGNENHFLFGNHDDRIYQFAGSCVGVLRDYARDGIKRVEGHLRKVRAKHLPYDSALGVLNLGKLSIIHGFHAGMSAASQHARIYRNCLYGHCHVIESAPVAALEPAEAKCIGCMCIRDMDYANAKTGKLRWAQGFAYGLLFEDGSYHLEQARKINGKFICSTDFRSY